MKLHYKLYLFFAGVVLLPLLVATVAASVVLSRSGTETYESRIRSGLAAASALISGEAQVLAGDFQAGLASADIAALASGDTGRTAAALNAVRERASAHAALIMDAGGNIIAAAGESPAEGPPLLASSTRLTDAGGSALRVAVFREFDTEPFSSIFSSQDLDWAILDGNAVALGSLPPGQDVSGSRGEPVDASGADQFFQADAGGTGMLASAVTIPPELTSRKTVLIAGVQGDIVGAASRQALQIGLGLMVLVAALAATLGYLLAHTITSPIRELNSAAAAGARGNLEQRVEVRSRDELGSLGRSFNRMQESLKKHIAELEESRTHLLLALSYTGDILGSTTNRSRLVKTTSEAARLATGVGAIWVELFESREPPVHSEVSHGTPAGFFQEESAAAVKQLTRDMAAGRIGAGEPARLDEAKDMAAFPLMHDKNVLGALVAVYDRNEPLDESRGKILGSLAAQAGSALENVNFSDLQQLLAITDPMTGLYNFRYLNNSMEAELRKCGRYGHRLSLAIIDLDDFKSVNDTHGHAAGDALLKAVAETILGNVRGADMVSRYGGEEFVVVFPETSKEAATGVGEKLRLAIEGIVLEEHPDIRITASIGIASYPEDGDDRTGLLVRADKALYRAKGTGKNRVVAA